MWDWPYFCKKLASIDAPSCCGVRYRLQPYPDHLQSLLRYRFTDDHRCFACPNFKRGLVEDYFHLLVWMAGETRGSQLLHMIGFIMSHLAADACVHAYLKFTKAVTALAKKGGRYISPLWRFVCYWETALGYCPEGKLEDLEESVQDWLLKPHPNGEMIGEDHFLYLLYDETVRFFTEEWSMPAELPTLMDWISSAMWMRGKGGSGFKTKVTIQSKRITTRRNKGVDAVFMSDPAIYEEMMTPRRQRLEVMQKREPGKVRPVVKADNELFRKMDFLSEIIETGLKGCRSSPIFMSSAANERLDFSIKERLAIGINCPLDQGSFDNNQSKMSILVVMIAMYQVMFRAAPPEYKKVWAAMWDSFVDPASVVILGKKRYPWENGIASGWRWTALLGTVLNITSFRAVKRIAVVVQPGLETFDDTHQGDDIHFKVHRLSHADTIIRVMTKCGYVVNPLKTYFSSERSEFLRRSYELDRITGYAGRTMTGMRFRNPIHLDNISKPARAYERIALAMMLLGRGAAAASVSQYMLEDAKQLGISNEDIADFCLTPNAMGGVGLWSSSPAVSACLAKYSTGRWLGTVTTKKGRDVKVDLGWWNVRLAEHADVGPFRKAFLSDLLQSWGIPTTSIYGDVNTEWVEVPKVDPLHVEGGLELPPAAAVWKKLTVPTLLLPHWKQNLVRTDDFIPYIKDEYLPLVLQLRDRVSSTVFIQYLTGTYSVPNPMVEGIGLKYGVDWKRKADKWMLRAMSAQHTNVSTLRRKMLWIELQGRQYISSLLKYGLLGS